MNTVKKNKQDSVEIASGRGRMNLHWVIREGLTGEVALELRCQ